MRYSLNLLFVLFAARLGAVPVSGHVRELGETLPIAGAEIGLQGGTLTAQSKDDGSWALDLPAGESVLQVSADNFGAKTFKIVVPERVPEPAPSGPAEGMAGTSGQALVHDVGIFSLARVDFDAEEVIVHGRRESEAPSRVALQAKEIRRIAGIGRDPLRALQTLPGVVTPSDFSGQLAVRGGGPQDNAYYLNEVPWPVPFHFGGALSTVHGDLLQGVDFYPAAFPPRWGGVDGAILDAHSRGGKRDQLHGQVDVNLLLSEALFEGPLGSGPAVPDALANTSVGAGSPRPAPAALPAPQPNGSWLISGRRSYLDVLLGHIGAFTALPRFWDLSLIGDYDLGPNDSIRITALGTDDILALTRTQDDVSNKEFEGDFTFHNSFESLGLNWKHERDGWRSTFTPYAYRSSFASSFGKGYGLSIQPTVGGLREDLRKASGAHEIGLGWGVAMQQYQVFGYTFRRSSGGGSGAVTLTDAAGITISATAIDNNLYLQDRIALADTLHVLAGVRWQQVNQMSSSSTDPRVNAEWQACPRTLVTAGWGQYSEFPTPQQLSADFGNPSLGFNRTEHLVAGVEQGFGANTTVKVEGYYKTYRERVVSVSDARLYANVGSGQAKGVELLLRQEISRRFFGWLSYSYAQSERLADQGQPWLPYQYDQPHTLTVVGSYDLTPAWSAGLKLNYHSGVLVTPVISRVADPDPNNISGWLPVYGVPYSERLGDYLRLDVRSDYAWRLEGYKIDFYAEVINALNRPNPAGVEYSRDFSQRKDVNNLPLLPYVGLGVEF